MQENRSSHWGDDVFGLLSWFEADKVRKARVLVVGAGALGNEVLKNLALFGVGHIYVVDYDTIEYSNLTRSILFREADADCGLMKAEVAAKRIREINPSVDVHAIVGRLDNGVGLGLYRSVDVVIGCLDSRLARLQLNRQCMRAGVPWVDGGIENLEGVARVFRRGVSCYECGLPETTKEYIYSRMSCADVAQRNVSVGRIPTTPVIASIIGAVQVQEAMKIIHSKGNPDDPRFTSLEGRWFHYEGSHMTTSVYSSAVWNDECSSHEDWTPTITLPDLGAENTVADALSQLRHATGCNEVEINLRNDRFVDRIVTRGDNTVLSPMRPASQIADYIDSEPSLYTRRAADINQNSFENIDAHFPYPGLTLHQLGLPYWDIIQVSTEKGYHYVELAKDRDHYES